MIGNFKNSRIDTNMETTSHMWLVAIVLDTADLDHIKRLLLYLIQF